LLFSCNNYRASRGPADWIYVATTGNDGTGDGSSGAPYLTIGHAVSQASAGDTVFVKAGSYTISTQVAVGTGISLYTNEAVTLTAGAALNPMFLYESASENTSGNQSVSHIKFDGDSISNIAINVIARGNVKVHDCTFDSFLDNGVRFTGRLADGAGAPTTYAEDNYLYNCTFIDCGGEVFSDPYYYASPAISIGGQKDPQIYNNVVYSNNGTYGYGLSTNKSGYNCGANIHDNIILTSPRRMDDGQWNFGIELWNNRGGMTVKDNYVTGSIDIGGTSSDDSQGYGFAILIEGNVVEQRTLQAYNQTGIILESDISGGTKVVRNKIKNCSTGISLNLLSGPTDIQSDIIIAYNLIIETLKTTGNYSGRGINHGTAVSGATVNRLKILNNTFYAATYISSAAVHLASSGVTYNDLEIRNNISVRQYNAFRFENNTIAGLDLTDNLIYQHTNAVSFVSSTVSDSVTIPRVLTDPLFRTGSFRLQSTSPAINAGTPVGLTTDFAGHRIPQQDTVDIGAYEYGNYLFRTPSGHLLRNANGKLMISH
jgi:hypothetical protein